jgi:4-hydroxyphenylpyruvate dioxygenase
LEIICLQPFAGYEGLTDRTEHKRRIEELRFWFQLAQILRTDSVQIPSSFLPEDQTSADVDLIVADLIELADLGLQQSPPIRFVYEALCFATHTDTWEKSWDIVQRIDRPNFGLCLDTFNILGRIYADPASPTGKIPNAEAIVRESIVRLKERIDIKKVFYVQVVDAERLARPLVKGHAFYSAGQRPRMSWSRNCRLFYGETAHGAYLPVLELARTIFKDLGFEGWVSLELFNRLMSDPGSWVPETLARRGAISWQKLVNDLDLHVDENATPGVPQILQRTKVEFSDYESISASL